MNLRELPFHALVRMGQGEGPERKTWPLSLQEATKPTVSLGLEAPAREALKLMCEDNVPGVPVVGEDGALEGFVTVGYLIASALPRYMRLMDNLS
jgi:CBS-domain-containing membrane protein